MSVLVYYIIKQYICTLFIVFVIIQIIHILCVRGMLVVAPDDSIIACIIA